MSLFRSSLRPRAILSDETIERYLTAARAEFEPDPSFRRRLRGHVMNRFVAAREGQVAAAGPPAKEMGRLGRAVLYASFALSLSVTGAMAASQQAIPGDSLYALKLQIEQLRLQVLPMRLHDDLAAHALGERIKELSRLTESGNWSAATAHADAVEAAYDRVVALSPDVETLAGHLAVPRGLLQRLPEPAQHAVDRSLLDSPGRGDAVPTGDDPSTRGGGGASSNGDGGGSDAGNGDGQGSGGGGSGGGGSAEPPAADPPDAPGNSSSDTAHPTPRAEPQPAATPGGAAESSNPPMSPKPHKVPNPPERP